MQTSSLKAYPFTLVKSVMIILLVALLLIVLCAVGLFSHQARQSGLKTNEQLLTSQGEVAKHRLVDSLETPRRLASLMQQYLQGSGGQIDDGLIRPEMDYISSRAFIETPALHSFSFSGANGEHLEIERDSQTNRLFLERTHPDNVQRLITYSGLTEASNIETSVDKVDIRSRAWFVQAQKQRTPWWAATTSSEGIAITYYLPVYTRQGTFQGVISSSLHPANLSHYLSGLAPDEEYALIIMDGRHKRLAQSTNFTATGVQPALLSQSVSGSGALHFTVNGKAWLATGFDLQDKEHQLNWRGYLMVPADKVLAGIHRQYLLVTVCVIALILLLMLGIGMVILRFIGSLKETEEKVKALGQLPWDKESKRRPFPELVSLNDELERVSQVMPGALSGQRTHLEEDDETGLLTLGGLLNTPSLYENRNLMAMIQVSNFQSVKNALGSTLAREFIQFFVGRLRTILPEGALCCRDREDTLIVAFAGQFEHKDVAWYRSILSSVFRMNTTALDGESHFFTGHVGMVICPLTKETISECLRNASLAVHHAQTQANGTCELFTPQMREEEVNNLRLHQALRDDLQNEVFHLVMQPIVPFVEGAPCMEGECLIRWQSNVLGFVPPDKFIALAEYTGMIVPLGKWIIDTACRELAQFIQRGASKDFKLHINISAVQLQQADFARHLLECVHRYELKNSNICIEITESVLLQDTQRIADILAYLRRLGISVAIDDFGSGYSSLSYLHSLPFDCLKIDRGFVRNVLDDPKSQAVISSVLMLSRSFDVPLVAEGVETKELAEKLHSMGCNLAQGYYYSRPKRFADFTPVDGQFSVVPD
jgi:FOG: EAL domain